MAAQQIQIAETIRAMKLALKRRADDSDSNDEIRAPSNRGHKLQRRARYTQSGRLDTTGGTHSYRKKVEHAGYTRHVIAKQPDYYDLNGALVAEDDPQEAYPVEDYPFAHADLHFLLRPLTKAAELPDHRSLGVGMKSKALTQMVDEAAEMVRRERAALWKAKRLLQRFRGDADWMPCEVFATDHDELFLLGGIGTEGLRELGSAVPSVNTDHGAVQETREVDDVHSVQSRNDIAAQAMDGIETADMAARPMADASPKTDDKSKPGTGNDNASTKDEPPATNVKDAVNGNADAAQATALTSIEQPADDASDHASSSGKDTNITNPTQHAMTTRARARSPVQSASPSPTPSDSASIPPIHPWFLIPPSALPDRDLGLPAPEADESRRLLLLYVQKQEQIVRSLDSLYNGLQRADRIRREVYRACKADGHLRDDGRGNRVTEMSDGEDWYDPADWGLDARDMKIGKNGKLQLEKGKDEADEVVDEAEGRRGVRRKRVQRM